MPSQTCSRHTNPYRDFWCVWVWDPTSPSAQRQVGFHVIIGHPEEFSAVPSGVRVLVCPARRDAPSQVTGPGLPATPQDAQWASTMLMTERPNLFQEFHP